MILNRRNEEKGGFSSNSGGFFHLHPYKLVPKYWGGVAGVPNREVRTQTTDGTTTSPLPSHTTELRRTANRVSAPSVIQ